MERPYLLVRSGTKKIPSPGRSQKLDRIPRSAGLSRISRIQTFKIRNKIISIILLKILSQSEIQIGIFFTFTPMNIETLYSMYLRSQTVSTDTRDNQMKSIFFALKGDNFNGNKFAQEAIKSGALFAIVDEKEFEDIENDIYYVEDTLNALQKLAQYHREQLKIPVIALTGSNGKTTTKELITQVL